MKSAGDKPDNRISLPVGKLSVSCIPSASIRGSEAITSRFLVAISDLLWEYPAVKTNSNAKTGKPANLIILNQ